MDISKPERYLLERSAAFLIDVLLAVVVLGVVFIWVSTASAHNPGLRPSDLFGEHFIVIGLGVFVTPFVLGLGYFLFRDGFARGSFGKRLFGLVVVDLQTGIPSGYLSP